MNQEWGKLRRPLLRRDKSTWKPAYRFLSRARRIWSKTGNGKSPGSLPSAPPSLLPMDPDPQSGTQPCRLIQILLSTVTPIGRLRSLRKLIPTMDFSNIQNFRNENGPSSSSTKDTDYVAETRTVLSMCSNCGAHVVLTLRRLFGSSQARRSSTTPEIFFLCSICGTRGSFDRTGISSVTFVESLKLHGLPRWVSSGRVWRTSSKNLSHRSP